MTDRRSGPPLFDLMRERGEHPDAPKLTPKPMPSPSHAKPATPPPGALDSGPEVSTKQTAWDTSGGVSRAERSAAAMLDEPTTTDSGIRLSSPMFYTMIVVAFVLIIGAWTVGYQRGNTAGKKAIEPYVRDQPVVRPKDDNPADTLPIITPKPVISEPKAQVEPEPSTTPVNPDGHSILTPSGFIAADPREPGLNYLVLATLDTEQAADAISFMYLNSVSVIGVPVLDSRASGANNPSRYTLYSLGVAIPGNQWSAMSVQRSQHQRLIEELGARWQRERRGGSDFSKTNWEKFEP